MRTTTLFLLLFACGGCSQQQQSPPTLQDMDRIQGTWQLTSGERHGEKFAAEITKNVKLMFAGAVLKTQNGENVTEATFKLHPELTPKGIDLDMDGSPGLGIYKLDGNTLAIVHGEVNEPRPADFDAVKDGNFTLLVLTKMRD